MAYFSGFVILDGSKFDRHASIVCVLYSQSIDTHTLFIVVRLLNYPPTYDVLEFGEPCCPIVVYRSHHIMSIFTVSFIHFSFQSCERVELDRVERVIPEAAVNDEVSTS
jgi:hypothetical protein